MEKQMSQQLEKQSPSDWINEMSEVYGELITMDGFEDCIEGICNRYGQDAIVCYSLDKVIDKLVFQGMTPEEAVEYWEYNQLGAYVGEKTPCFITKYKHGDTNI
jgi:hypothetical protein